MLGTRPPSRRPSQSDRGALHLRCDRSGSQAAAGDRRMTDEPVSPPERMPDIRVTVMAADANPYGTAFVGWLFGQMSLAGGSLASRRTGKRAPVGAADGFKFTAPAALGDEL